MHTLVMTDLIAVHSSEIRYDTSVTSYCNVFFDAWPNLLLYTLLLTTLVR